ncbi:MAG: hypothetical protein IJR67_01400 [Acholeplasmatales bacterium]|nr:hypothetical protein [Acholeplasmatales bacterium]
MEILLDDYKEYVFNGLWTKAINMAICDLKIDDTLVFSKNKVYESGTIFLKSNIKLKFEHNAVLKASSDINLFNISNNNINNLEVNTFINCDYDGNPKLYFIYGKNIENVEIIGKGIIDGNEEIFYGEIEESYIEGKFYPRMPLIYLENSKNLEFNNITLRNSAFWTLHLVGCEYVIVDGVKILNNRRMLNADGIDPDHSKNIVIKNCYIESADDCIVLKGTGANTKYGDVYNIHVSNCTLKSSSAAIKIGTETFAKFYDIHFDNIKIKDSNRGISFQLRDDGEIKDITFNNIDIESHMFDPKPFWGKGEAISISAVRRTRESKIGTISNISFNNINAKSEKGIFLYSNSDNIFDLSFNNININLVDVTKYDKRIYDLRPNDELKTFTDDNAIIYARGIKNINFKNFNKNKNDLVNDSGKITYLD